MRVCINNRVLYFLHIIPFKKEQKNKYIYLCPLKCQNYLKDLVFIFYCLFTYIIIIIIIIFIPIIR